MKFAKTSDTDSVRAYLREIGRVPLLTHEQEIVYGKQVQHLNLVQNQWEDLATCLGRAPSPAEWAEAAGLSEAELERVLERGEVRNAKWWRRTCV